MGREFGSLGRSNCGALEAEQRRLGGESSSGEVDKNTGNRES